MPYGYVWLLIMLGLAAGVAMMMMFLPLLLGPRNPVPTKYEPYESGMKPFMLPRRRFPVHYYLVAILFVVFDIEILFLYPWAVILRDLRWFGLVEMGVFLGIVLVGFVYAWRKGALEWIR